MQAQFSLQIHLLKNLVIPNITRNHGTNLLGFKQLAETNTRHARVVADDGEICKIFAVAECVDECGRYTGEAESSYKNGGV
jgi:hypothetical protein